MTASTSGRRDAVARELLARGSELVGLQALDGTLLFINPVVDRMLGYGASDVIGRPIADFVHPDDLGSVVAAQAKLVEQGGIGPGMETRIRRADGSWNVLDIVTTNMLDTPEVEALLFIARDVTDRRAAERRAGDREASFRLLAENATDVISRSDAAGICLWASPSARSVLGFDPTELVGQRMDTLLVPDDDAAYKEARRMVQLGAVTFTITHQVRRRDGHAIWLESTSRVTRDPATGEVVEVQSSARDVSDRIHLEERFEALVRHSSDIITILGADGSWRYSSPAGTRLLGWPAGYTPEGGILSLVHPEDVEAAAQALREVIDGSRGPDDAIVLRGRHTDGRYLHFETTGQNLLDDPVVGGIVLTARDITEQEEAERLARDLIEAAPDAMVIIDLSGRIQLVNAQTDTLFCYPRGELLGQSIEVLVPERLRAAHQRDRDRYVVDPKQRPMGAGRALLGRDRDGREFPVEVSLSPITTGETTLVAAAIRDVTERLETQRELQRRAIELERLASLRERQHLELELERSRRFESMGRLAGGVAHDVNTLIGIVMIYLNAITDELDADERRRADADHIRSAVRRIARLTRQLLEYGRRPSLPPATFDPDAVIPEIVDLARMKNGAIVFEYRPASPTTTIRMSIMSFEQMLMNVLTNATDAMPEGGTITIRTDSVWRGCEDEPKLADRPFVRLRVSDTGRGMTTELAATAFEPFVTTRDEEGTGLGLAIVEGIVRDVGGSASLDSRLGGGTEVTLLIPAADATESVTAS